MEQQNVAAAFAAMAADPANRDRPCLVSESETLTIGQVDDVSSRICNWLRVQLADAIQKTSGATSSSSAVGGEQRGAFVDTGSPIIPAASPLNLCDMGDVQEQQGGKDFLSGATDEADRQCKKDLHVAAISGDDEAQAQAHPSGDEAADAAELDEPECVAVGVALEAGGPQTIAIFLGILKAGAAYVPINPAASRQLLDHILATSRPFAVFTTAGSDVVRGLPPDVLAVDGDKFWGLIRAPDASNVRVAACPAAGRPINTIRTPPTVSLITANDGSSPLSACSSAPPVLASQNVACILYTSGSTGLPKPVPLTHRMILARLRWQWVAFPFRRTSSSGGGDISSNKEHLMLLTEEVCCSKTAYTFVDSVAEIFGPLLRGVKLVVFGAGDVCDPERFLAKLDEHGITRLVLVPSVLKAMLTQLAFTQKLTNRHPYRADALDATAHVRHQHPAARGRGGTASLLPSLQLWICSGETLSRTLAEAFFDTFTDDLPCRRVLCNFYGSTEVMGDVLYHTFESKDDVARTSLADGTLPLGLPIADNEILLLDENGDVPVPVQVEGKAGEICVTGSFVAELGYLGVEDSGKFVARVADASGGIISPGAAGPLLMYRTGDLVICVSGLYYFIGRKDSVVKIRGKKVSLEAVEALAAAVPGVARAVAVCDEDQQDGLKTGVVVFFTSSDPTMTQENLRQLLAQREEQAGWPGISNGSRRDGGCEDMITDSSLFSSVSVIYIKVEEIPNLPNGKPDRCSLLGLFQHHHNGSSVDAGAGSSRDEQDANRQPQSSSVAMDKVLSTYQLCYQREAMALWTAIERVLGQWAAAMATSTATLSSIGGNSLTTFQLVHEIDANYGVKLGIGELLKCETFNDVVVLMRTQSINRCVTSSSSAAPLGVQGPTMLGASTREVVNGVAVSNHCSSSRVPGLRVVPLADDAVLGHPNIYRVAVDSFVEKGRLESQDISLAPSRQEFDHFLKATMPHGLSVLAYDGSNDERIVGLALNADCEKKVDLAVNGRVPHYTEFTLWLKEKLWPDAPREQDHVVTSLWTVVDPELSPTQAVEVMIALESASLALAQDKGYKYACAANIHPVAQQISRTLGFEIKGKWHMKDFINSQGRRIYEMMPEDFYKELAVKDLLQTC